MDFNTMMMEICEECLITPEELYHLSSWIQTKFTEDDFDDEGQVIE